MFVISTRSFPPETGGMQNLMGGLANALLNHGPVKVFADKFEGSDVYDQSLKLEIERLLEWYGKLTGLKFANLRYFNAAGHDPSSKISHIEKDPENLIPIVMEVASGKRRKVKIFGNNYNTKDGTPIRDYIHIEDLAKKHEDPY